MASVESSERFREKKEPIELDGGVVPVVSFESAERWKKPCFSGGGGVGSFPNKGMAAIGMIRK